MTPKWKRLEPILTRGKWNFVHVVDAVMECSLSRTEKITLIAIATHRSNKHPKPSPGLRRLASLCSQRVQTTSDAIEGLAKKGIIRLEKGHRRSNVYDLSRTMRALLTVAPTVTVTVTKEDTDGEQKPDLDCDDPGHSTVTLEDQICDAPAYPRDQEGTKEGTISASASDAVTSAVSRRSSKKKPAKRSEDGKAHQAIIESYSLAYERARGCKPIISGQNAKAAKKLREDLGLDGALAVIDRAFTDDWFVTNNGDLTFIASHVNKYRGTKPLRNTRGTPQQPSTGYQPKITEVM